MLTLLVLAGLLVMVRRRHGRSPAHRRARVRALVFVAAVLGFNLVLGGPAMAQGSDCVRAPDPERPGAGLVGTLDPSEGHGVPGSPYADHGYAGMVWHFYEDSCALRTPFTDPGPSFDTLAGNTLFDIAKNIVGVTNSLHHMLFDGAPFGQLNNGVDAVARAAFDNIYLQLLSVCLVVVAVLMFRGIWRGDFAAVSRRALVVFCCIWFASSSVLMLKYSPEFDDLIVYTTNRIRTGFTAAEHEDALPTALHDRVVYENWLRGEFDSPDSPDAEKYGRRLLAAQAWTWDDVHNTASVKKEEYKAISADLGAATGYFKGNEGSRVGAGFLALLQALAYSLFQLLTNLAVSAVTGELQMLALIAPVVGLVGMFNRGLLRRVIISSAAQVYHVLVLSVLAGIHFRFLQLLFAVGDGRRALFVQMIVAGIVTVFFMKVGRPVRRLIDTLPLGDVQAVVGASSLPGVEGQQLTMQEAFWRRLADNEPAQLTAAPTRGPRPEMIDPAPARPDAVPPRPSSNTPVMLPPAVPATEREPSSGRRGVRRPP